MNQYKFFHFAMVKLGNQSIFFDLKNLVLLTNQFLLVNNHTVLFIMNFFDYIQVPISKSKDILITVCI